MTQAVAETGIPHAGKETFDRLGAANARVQNIVHIAGAIAGDGTFGDSLLDFLESEFDEIEACLGTMPGELQAVMDTFDMTEEFRAWALQNGKLGFLVQVATPGGSLLSWGWYKTAWFYGETWEEALEKGLAWAQGVKRE